MGTALKYMRITTILFIGMCFLWEGLNEVPNPEAPIVPCIIKLIAGLFIFAWFFVANNLER